jgi:8-oxo-dGTP diphosphatase
MVKSAVAAIVNYNGKVLLGKKRKDSSNVLAGEWHLPGEKVENGESDESALLRCLNEEASIDIRVGKYLGSHFSPTNKRKVNWYECFSETDSIFCGSDLEDVKWVLKKEVLNNCGEEARKLLPNEIIEYFN